MSLELVGADVSGRVLIANEAYAVILGSVSEATVIIADDNGM